MSVHVYILSNYDKEYIRYHLFYKREYDIEDLSERKRYEGAGKFGMLYTKHIDLLSSENRIRDLRQFSRMTCQSKNKTYPISKEVEINSILLNVDLGSSKIFSKLNCLFVDNIGKLFFQDKEAVILLNKLIV